MAGYASFVLQTSQYVSVMISRMVHLHAKEAAMLSISVEPEALSSRGTPSYDPNVIIQAMAYWQMNCVVNAQFSAQIGKLA